MTKYYKIDIAGDLVSMVMTKGYDMIPCKVIQGLPEGAKLCHAIMTQYNNLELTFFTEEEGSGQEEPEHVVMIYGEE